MTKMLKVYLRNIKITMINMLKKLLRSKQQA